MVPLVGTLPAPTRAAPQDPIAGPNVSYIAGQWTDAEVTHIVSVSASEEANANFTNYGGKVALRGSGGVIRGPLPD